MLRRQTRYDAEDMKGDCLRLIKQNRFKYKSIAATVDLHHLIERKFFVSFHRVTDDMYFHLVGMILEFR